MLFILRKGVKSIQNALNEFMGSLMRPLVTNAAFSKARQNLSYTAFKALNQDALVPSVYTDAYVQFSNLRILAVDGSKIILPQTEETIATFGIQTIRNQHAPDLGTFTYGLASVLYDVLNGVALDAQLVRGDTYEVDVAETHLSQVRAGDLVIYDRGYCSFRMMYLMAQTQGDFCIRCSNKSFSIVNKMFCDPTMTDVTVHLTPSAKHVHRYGAQKNISLRVRFVRVVLKTGTVEILATSLLDTDKYPHERFGELYAKRWGVETFYGTVKTRLELEHFMGLSVESILQEFHATIFLTGLEAQLSAASTTRLKEKACPNVQQVNRALSFNALKHRAFDLLVSDKPIPTILDELTALFLKRPLVRVASKKPPRTNRSSTTRLNFWKRKRTHVF